MNFRSTPRLSAYTTKHYEQPSPRRDTHTRTKLPRFPIRPCYLPTVTSTPNHTSLSCSATKNQCGEMITFRSEASAIHTNWTSACSDATKLLNVWVTQTERQNVRDRRLSLAVFTIGKFYSHRIRNHDCQGDIPHALVWRQHAPLRPHSTSVWGLKKRNVPRGDLQSKSDTQKQVLLDG